MCHDVRAYMSGGYGVSQDQGSSNILFKNNVCLRTSGSPHNTHYGVNLTYENNVFWGGYYDSWAPDGQMRGSAALQTSPNLGQAGCGDSDFSAACPDQITFVSNLIGHSNNASSHLFDGDWNETTSSSPGAFRFNFSSNYYWSEVPTEDLARDAVFGGKSKRMNGGKNASHLTWNAWRSLHGGMQDSNSMLGAIPFVDESWAYTLNVTIAPDSPLLAKLGWQQIDSSTAGPRPASVVQTLPTVVE